MRAQGGLGPLFEYASKTKCQKLRLLLCDGAWHSQHEMARVAGYRYGGVLHCIAHGRDGEPPVSYVKEQLSEDRTAWRYRQVGYRDSTEPEPETLQAKVARLERENRHLRAEVVALEQLLKRRGDALRG